MTGTRTDQTGRADTRNGVSDEYVEVLVKRQLAAEERLHEQHRDYLDRVYAACTTGETCGDCGRQLDDDDVVRVAFERPFATFFDGVQWHRWLAGPVCLDCYDARENGGRYTVIGLWGDSDRGDWCWLVKPCRGCGRMVHFMNDRRRRVVACSERCRHRSRRKLRYRPSVRCAECKAEFTPARADARFCSPACRQAAYRRRKADR